MRQNIRRSKGIACTIILLFLISVTVEAWTAYGPPDTKNDGKPVVRVKRAGGHIPLHQVERFEELFAEGKRLLQEEFDYEGAIGKFTEALRYAALKEQKSDVYFYLSLAYYATPDIQRQEDFVDAIKKLIEINYYWQLDEAICPRRYIERYQEIKRGYGALRILSNPSGADVYLDGSRRSAGKTPLTLGRREGEVAIEVKKGSKSKKDSLRVVAGKETTSPEYILGGKSSMLYIVGGIVVAGGIGAALLLGGGSEEPGPSPTPTPNPTTGSLQINSQPSGAAIFMDGNDTGMMTNATITDLSPGSYQVRLIKEGYEDYEETANVTAGQTTTLNAPLEAHQITIVSPTGGDYLTKGKDLEIRWDVSGLSARNTSTGPQRSVKRSINSLRNSALIVQRRARRFRNISGLSRNASRRSETLRSSRHGARREGGFSSSAGTQAELKAEVRTKDLRAMDQSAKNLGFSHIDLADPGRRSSDSRLKKYATPSDKAQPTTLTNIRIQLFKSGEKVKTITSETDNDGLFTWTVATSLQDGQDYVIRVSSKAESDVYGESEEFSILDAGNFDENFDDDTFVKKYFTESHPYSWKVEGGVYRADRIVGNARSYSFFNSGDYSDFSFEAKCGNGNDNVWYGIAFRGTDNFRNFCFFYVNSEGMWELRRKLADSTDEEVLERMSSTAIQTGFNKWNTLKVEATGHTFRFYINGILVHSTNLNDLSLEGKIGLVTRINYSDVKFDDLSVRIIE